MTSSTTTGTYFYSPDIKIFVKSATVKDSNGNPAILDLSDDITSFTISRQSNATSSAQFTVANKGWKYTIPPANIGGSISLPIETMDQVVIYLKRDTYLQYFTGYITNAPVLTLIPQPVTFQAQCTIYKIQNTFWDVNNLSFQSLMPGMLMTSVSGTSQWADGGAAQGIVNVLGNVVGVPLSSIHVASIPPTWIANSAKAYNLLYNGDNPYLPQHGAQTLMRALDGAGIISGNNLINNKNGAVTYSGLSDAQTTAVTIPNGALTNAVMDSTGALVYNIHNGGGFGIIAQTVDVNKIWDKYHKQKPGKPQPVKKENQDPDYWCVISWPYFVQNFDERTTADAAKWLGGSSVNWSNGRPLLVTSIANAKQVVVKASIAGDTGGNIVLSRAAWEYLAGSPITYNVGPHQTANGGTVSTGDFYLSNSIQVTLDWADPTKVHQGPQDTTNLVNQLESYGYSLGNTIAQSTALTTTASGSPDVFLSSSTAGGPPPHQFTPILSRNIPDQYKKGNSSDWAYLCLMYAGFPVTTKNIALINLWIHLENGSGWADYYNPLGDSDTSLTSKYSKAPQPGTNAFQSLDIAAQWWGYKMNTPTYWAVGAVFDSRPRYQNTPTKSNPYGTSYTPDSKKRKPLPTAQHPEITLQGAIDIFKKQVIKSPWAGGAYKSERDAFTISNTKPLPKINAGIAAPKPYGKWDGPKGTSVTYQPSTGAFSTDTNTGTNFNISFNPPQIDINTLTLLGTPRAFVTDQPVLQSIATMVQSSLRHFQSAPNGDFLAWFPDYFGLYGQAPSLSIHDIEIIDFTISHDDTQLATHIAVSGDLVNMGTGVGLIDWLQTNGIVSVQIPEVMAILFGFASAGSPNTLQDSINALNSKFGKNFANDFLARYGVRPLVQQQPLIRSHVTEFMYAWQLFMTSWANQYSSTIQLTFMPELYPGMRIRLEDHGIEVYVQSVQHQGDRAGGFYTSASVTCPVYRKNVTSDVKLLHYGFPQPKN